MVYEERETKDDFSQMDVPADNAFLQTDWCELPTLGLKELRERFGSIWSWGHHLPASLLLAEVLFSSLLPAWGRSHPLLMLLAQTGFASPVAVNLFRCKPLPKQQRRQLRGRLSWRKCHARGWGIGQEEATREHIWDTWATLTAANWPGGRPAQPLNIQRLGTNDQAPEPADNGSFLCFWCKGQRREVKACSMP